MADRRVASFIAIGMRLASVLSLVLGLVKVFVVLTKATDRSNPRSQRAEVNVGKALWHKHLLRI